MQCAPPPEIPVLYVVNVLNLMQIQSSIQDFTASSSHYSR